MAEGKPDMIGASKILTVSYGTFSCTLEGFDDPFNTMRAIAEYFRDLAAEDRYFGAEPPTPDAAMLHKIAEREINRRVEANIQENGVVLRAGNAAPAKPTPNVADFAPMDAQPAPRAPLLTPSLTNSDPAEVDSVANRLQRLRAAQTIAQGAIHPVTDVLADDAEDMLSEASDPWAADSLASVMAELDEALPAEVAGDVANVQTTEIESFTADIKPVSAPEPVDAAPTLPPVEELAAPEFDRMETPQDDAPATVEFRDTLAAEAAELEPSVPFDTAADDAPEPPVQTPSEEAILQATRAAMIDPDGDDEDEVTAAAPAPATMAEAPFVADAEPVFELPRADVEELAEEPSLDAKAPVVAYAERDAGEPSAEEDDPSVVGDDEQDTVTKTDSAPATAADAEPQGDTRSADRLQRARARVIKIRRIDIGATSASQPQAVVPPTAADDAAPEATVAKPTAPVHAELPDAGQTALSPEAEAELMRELADLEADLSPVSAVSAPTDVPEAEADVEADALPVAEPPAQPTPAAPSMADDAVNRLISQTNAAMEGPENKRRLAAIAHLKAAVAATFADRKANATPAQPGQAERMDPYREDLDRVVRPRRPALIPPSTEAAPQPSPRPAMENRPAPLVLVSEQRIDRPAVAPAKPFVAPVRPRRVTTDLPPIPSRRPGPTEAVPEDDDAGLSEDDVNNIFADPSQPFAEFAERLGAVTMPELMEAAAAYCALQLGRDQFTRPLLLQQIAELPTRDAFNREDCLRGFGTLLRDGRIQKIKRGQFKLSGQSRYLAEGKRLAG